jgi:hypothetical protein
MWLAIVMATKPNPQAEPLTQTVVQRGNPIATSTVVGLLERCAKISVSIQRPKEVT